MSSSLPKHSWSLPFVLLLVLIGWNGNVYAIPPIQTSTLPANNSSLIAFVAQQAAEQNIYLMNADGSNARALTNTAIAGWPNWSPDGTRLAFASLKGNSWIISIVDRSGSNSQILTDDGAYPAWSPNGQYIAFISIRDQRPRLYLMNTDGSHQRRLADIDVETETPIWSPDSGSVAVTSSKFELYTVKINDPKIQQIANFSNAPTWSPDGKFIAFAAYSNGGRWHIYISDVYGINQRDLTPSSNDDRRYPVWSPNGKYIAFSGFSDNKWNLYVMDADGSNSRLLTTNMVFGSKPVWSRDSKLIAYVAVCNGQSEIYIVDMQSSVGRCITTSGVREINPAWSP